MSSTSFLDKSPFNKPNYIVQYINGPSSTPQPTVTIYDDDTVKEVLIKLSTASKTKSTSNHVFAWITNKQGINIPLGFQYTILGMDDPYEDEQTDKHFVDSEGNYIILPIESTMNKIMEWFESKNNTINYTTLYDFIKYFEFDHNKTITDEECLEKTSYSCSDFFYGKIKKYWPRINNVTEFTNYNNTKHIQQINNINKSEHIIYERNKKLMEYVYKTKSLLNPDEFNPYLFSMSNLQDDLQDNNVRLFKLFTDIKLGNLNTLLISFTKITLDNYDDSYCKLSKDVISYEPPSEKVRVDPSVTQQDFLKWYRSQIITVPKVPVKFMDDRNSITLKLYKDSNYISLIIYSNGLAKVIFNDIPIDVDIHDYIKKKISLVNNLLKDLNEKKIYFEEPIHLINTNYKLSFDILTSSLIYPIESYDPDKFIILLNNLPTFVRFNKNIDNSISCIYKRVNDYNSMDTKIRVISLLHQTKKRGEIIEELVKIFNISEEDANDEYEQWEQLEDKGFQKTESGIEFIMDNRSKVDSGRSNPGITVDISQVSSYSEYIRIYKFMNFVMEYYKQYIDSELKKDPYNLFTTDKQSKEPDEIIDDYEARSKIDAASVQEKLIPLEEGDDDEDDDDDDDEVRSNIKSDSDSDSMGKLDSSSGGGRKGGGRKGGGRKGGGRKGGGRIREQTGGYDVYSYYNNRLKRFDEDVVTTPSGEAPKKNAKTYAKTCPATVDKQPIAIYKKDLDKINEGDEGKGKGYDDAVTIPGRSQDIYYMCPKYWDIKENRPRDPERVEEFKEHIVDNKMTTAQKKKTDKYILKREGCNSIGTQCHWKNAGDDISRYKVKLLDKWQNKATSMYPCCFMKEPNFKKGDTVLVLEQTEWKEGKVKSVDKKNKKVMVTWGGSDQPYDYKDVRFPSKTIKKVFPCDLGTYCQIDPIIKQLILQDKDFPIGKYKDSTDNIGLIRKGVHIGTSIKEQSLLDSLQVILGPKVFTNKKNTSVKALRDNILRDLKNHPDIFMIAGGSFINIFKTDITELDEKYTQPFIDIITDNYSFVKRNIKTMETHKNYKNLTGKEKLLKIFSAAAVDQDGIEEDPKDRSKLNQELNKYTSLIQFENYLTDKTEVILDKYIIPILISISKYPSSTFGEPIEDLSIVVFEGVNDDVFISPPIGGFPSKSKAMILLYKEGGHTYEPILYRRLEFHRGIIMEYADDFKDQNDRMQVIIQCIQDKMNELNNDNIPTDLFMDCYELTNIMEQLDLPILKYIYDNYHKIVYVITENNVWIPVRPCTIGDHENMIYITEFNEYPTYSDVIKVLSSIDSISTSKKYLNEAGISVIGARMGGKLITQIKEIIMDSGHYIPIKPEEYDNKKHKLDIVSINSLQEIDEYLSIYNKSNDDRYDYIQDNDYKKVIAEIFFQKVYLLIKEDEPLFTKIKTIKYHPIKLKQHKTREIYSFLDKKVLNDIIILEDEDYDLSLDDEKNGKLIIRNLSEDIDNKILYNKLLRLFIELLIIYDESEYERYLQIDISITKLKLSIQPNEILFTYTDIQKELYLDYFIKNSKYIRNVSLYGEGISKNKLIQLKKQKQKKSMKEIKFEKQYPRIIHTLFGRSLVLMKYTHDKYPELNVISDILEDNIDEDEEMNIEMIKSLLNCSDDHILNENDLDILSKTYNIGFCLVTQLMSKRIEHDVIIKIHKHALIDGIKMILLYQYENTLIHIQKNGNDIVMLEDLTSQLFKKHLKKVMDV